MAEPVEPAGETASDHPAGAIGPGEARPKSGLSSAAGEEFSVAAAIGGPRGVVESVGPPLLFIVAFTITRDLKLSLIVAVGFSVAALLLRVVTRSAPTQALSGVLGIVICAAFSIRTGEARDFFLPGFLINGGYGAACLLSLIPLPAFTVAGRRLSAGSYPLLGLFLGPLTGEGLGWRDFRPRRHAYVVLTAMWGAFFLLKLGVQLPLYLADQVQILGVAKLVMGVPSYLLMCWLTWLTLRRIPKQA